MLEIKRVPEPGPQPRVMVAEIRYRPDQGAEPTTTFPQFKLLTYDDLSKMTDDGAHIFAVVNQFFTTLADHEQVKMYRYYQWMHRAIQTITKQNLRSVTDAMTDATSEIMASLGLPQRLITFIHDAKVPFPDPTKKLMKGHFTEELTFHLPDYVDLTAISLLAKMMSPIWGDYIQMLVPQNTAGGRKLVTDESNKELFCFLLIIPTLEATPFRHVYYKLRNYLNNAVANSIKRQPWGGNQGGHQTTTDFILAKNGYGQGRFQETVYAVTVIKKMVIYNLWKSKNGIDAEPDMMKHINASIDYTANSKLKGMSNKTNVMARFELPDGAQSQDNTSNNDHVARISKTTFDIPIIAQAGALLEATRALQRYSLSPDVHTKAVNYHLSRGLEPSLFNRSLAASFYAKTIGGSSMLQYLPASVYIPVIISLQMYLISRDRIQLAHLLVCSTPKVPKTGPATSVASRIGSNFDKTREYNQCTRELFLGTAERTPKNPYRYGTDTSAKREQTEHINVRTQIQRIMEWIIDYDHSYNTSPAIWSMLPHVTPATPGDPVRYNEDVVQDFCSYLIDQHSSSPSSTGGG